MHQPRQEIKYLPYPFYLVPHDCRPIYYAIRKHTIEWDQIINGSNTSALYSFCSKQLSHLISVHKAMNRTTCITHKVKEKISVDFASNHIAESFPKESQSWKDMWIPVMYHNADFYLVICFKRLVFYRSVCIFFNWGLWKALAPWTGCEFSHLHGELTLYKAFAQNSLRIRKKWDVLARFSSWLSFDELSLQKSVPCTGSHLQELP